MRTLIKIGLWLLAVVIIAVGILLWKTSRAGYETAAYEVIETDGKVEIRDYAEHTLAITPMAKPGGESRDGGFNRLFRYISGENQTSQRIAMTTPVFIDQSPESEQTMAFVMPAEIEAPPASSEQVLVESVSPQRFAALRFRGGSRSREAVEQAKKALQQWVVEQNIETTGPVREAYYDPPWTPSFLRRNEVLVPLGPGGL